MNTIALIPNRTKTSVCARFDPEGEIARGCEITSGAGAGVAVALMLVPSDNSLFQFCLCRMKPGNWWFGRDAGQLTRDGDDFVHVACPGKVSGTNLSATGQRVR